MISNSWVWKRELRKELNAFNKYVAKTDFSEGYSDDGYIYLKIEKFFFVLSFIIRKLHESNKLSDELIATNIPIIKYRRINMSETIDVINKNDLMRFYDFASETKSSLGAIKLCHAFIHSYTFMPGYDEEYEPGKTKLDGVLVTSAYDKDEGIYYVTLSSFIKFVNEVITDEVVSIHFNRETGKHKKSREEA